MVLCSLACGLAAATAQQTWIVDPAGSGPFTDVQTAISAASPGDTILVRGGTYAGVIVDRSVHLLGDGARPSLAGFSCWPGTTVTVGSMDLGSVSLPSCRVAFDDVTGGQLRATGTSAVFVRCVFDNRSSTTGTNSIAAGSHVVFDGCQLFGSPGGVVQTLQCTPLPGGAALSVDASSRVELANTTCAGAGPLSFLCLNSPGTTGVAVASGGVVRAGRSTIQSGGPTVPAVTGGGTVLHEATQFAPAFAGTPAVVPIATGRGAMPGGALAATLVGTAQQPAALVASLGLRAPIAVPEGSAWIDPAAFVVLRLGLLDGNGELPVSIALPPLLGRGIALTVQGVTAAGGSPLLVASTPSVLQVL